MKVTLSPALFAKAVLTPTRLTYEIWRDNVDDPTPLARGWPLWWLGAEITACILIATISKCTGWSPGGVVAVILGYLALSRIVEIAYAFYGDAIDNIRGDSRKTTLSSSERVRLALMSYLALVLLWAIVYFCLPEGSFLAPFATFVDALYFSGVTLTTLGYGDIHPKADASKILSVCQVLSGVLVLVVALASYLSANEEKRGAGDA